jgi:hypothetical protein
MMIDHGKLHGCRALDLSNTVNLHIEAVHRLLTSSTVITQRLEALSYTGQDAITEQFWIDSIRYLHRLKSVTRKKCSSIKREENENEYDSCSF